jgi:regulator of RNase E activity RraA
MTVLEMAAETRPARARAELALASVAVTKVIGGIVVETHCRNIDVTMYNRLADAPCDAH